MNPGWLQMYIWLYFESKLKRHVRTFLGLFLARAVFQARGLRSMVVPCRTRAILEVDTLSCSISFHWYSLLKSATVHSVRFITSTQRQLLSRGRKPWLSFLLLNTMRIPTPTQKELENPCTRYHYSLRLNTREKQEGINASYVYTLVYTSISFRRRYCGSHYHRAFTTKMHTVHTRIVPVKSMVR